MKLNPDSVLDPAIIGAVLGAKAFAVGEWVQVGDRDPWIVKEIGDYDPGLIVGGLPPRLIGQAWRPYQVSFPSDRSLWSERQIRLINGGDRPSVAQKPVQN